MRILRIIVVFRNKVLFMLIRYGGGYSTLLRKSQTHTLPDENPVTITQFFLQ